MNLLQDLEHLWDSQDRPTPWVDLEIEEKQDFAKAIVNMALEVIFMNAQELSERCMSLELTDANGQYIPKLFAEHLSSEHWKVQNKHVQEALLYVGHGPDQEHYDEEWTTILDGFKIRVGHCEFGLHQNGDLWLINNTMLWLADDETTETMWNNMI